MNNHPASWIYSSLYPHFIIVQDTSSFNTHPKNLTADILTDPTTQINDINNNNFQILNEHPINIFPEIHYKFIDDDDQNTDLNNNNDNIIIIDFENDAKTIKSINCFSDDWQIQNIEQFQFDANSNNDNNYNNDLDNSVNLLIKGTKISPTFNTAASVSPAATTAASAAPALSDLDLHNLVALFSLRNRQLKQMMHFQLNLGCFEGSALN
ncbi:uncharacterized protein ASCRUDRAFT_73080 [Ascoidea rubescens DSM 1968]|uniref:Uncharacterized protein n=1 Tax=Ascoidea rubescens DSM 1968 TaxID=1344418 RepID=A0A1D2V8V2_9ASCO|nr:hypothetical protein ASCRUDRAFT_73080 [Ascoidea rubescens DSM 1968]ODV57873.1 hypothetical protein ASCRUDRAFT_73080 [Ascoidea rubescens DSM 1968]